MDKGLGEVCVVVEVQEALSRLHRGQYEDNHGGSKDIIAQIW